MLIRILLVAFLFHGVLAAGNAKILISIDISQCSGTTLVCLEGNGLKGNNVIAWPSKVFFKETIFSISLFPGKAYDQSLYCGPIDPMTKQPLASLKTWTVTKPSEDNSTYFTSLNLDSNEISRLSLNFPDGKYFFQIADESKQVCLIGPYSWTGISINTETTTSLTPSATATPTQEASSNSDPLSNPAILGAVIAASVIAGLILCTIFIRCCFLGRRREKEDPFGTFIMLNSCLAALTHAQIPRETVETTIIDNHSHFMGNYDAKFVGDQFKSELQSDWQSQNPSPASLNQDERLVMSDVPVPPPHH
jgi:hypothetical protein